MPISDKIAALSAASGGANPLFAGEKSAAAPRRPQTAPPAGDEPAKPRPPASKPPNDESPLAKEATAAYDEAALSRTRSDDDAASVVASSTASGRRSSGTASSSSAATELAEMRKKLGQFMLGGDMSGGQAGTHAALTLSNAITNLSVGCWSGVAELAPLPPANVSKWRQQVRWYTAPLEQIIVKEDGVKTLEDGTEVEVVHDVVREDVRVELPILIKCDDEQQALYARFLDVEWHYVKPTAKEAADEAAAPGGGGGGGGGGSGGRRWRR